jgi:hypothetical protein
MASAQVVDGSAVAAFLAKKKGSHTQFKGALSEDLRRRIEITVKQRTGPSFDERIAKAVAERAKKAAAEEAEQRKKLAAAIEKGRERKNESEVRPASAAPKQSNVLVLERQQAMKEREALYQEKMDALRDKMDRREPLFKLEDVADAFADLRRRKEENKRKLQKEEAETWAHIRDVYQDAHRRPLLVEDYLGRPPPKAKSNSAPAVSSSAPELPDRPHSAPFRGQEYECDKRIKAELSKKWFQKSQWGHKVREIKEKADCRQKLCEISYPPINRDFSITNSLLSYNFPVNKTAPSARGK